MKLLTSWCAAIVLAVLSLAAGHTSAAIGDTDTGDPGTTTWTLRPAGSGGAEGSISIRHDVDPGASVMDAVEVRNFGTSPATFRIYASDGVVGESGAFDVLPPGQESTDSGTWITFGDVSGASGVERDLSGAMEVLLEPESSAVVALTIAVPQGAVPGDHPAGVVAELVPEEEHTVQLNSRVGVRVHLRVTGEIEARVGAEDIDLSWTSGWNPFSDGSVQASYVLHNTGNIRVGTTSDLELAGPFGVLPAQSQDTRREILPGESVRVEVDLPLWGLVWTAGQITVTPATVGEDAPDVQTAPANTALGLWTVPWPQLGAILAVAIGPVLLRRRRRRAERGVQERIDAAVAAATVGPDPERRSVRQTEEDVTT